MEYKTTSEVIAAAGQMYGENINNAIAFITNNLTKEQRPEHPIVPKLKHIHTSVEAAEYAQALQHYEELVEEYKNDKKAFDAQRQEIDEAIIVYIRQQSQLSSIPEQYREKALDYIGSRTNGYRELFDEINDLAEIFS